MNRAALSLSALIGACLLPVEAIAQTPEQVAERERELEGAAERGRGPDAATMQFPGGYQLFELQPSERLPIGGGAPLTLGQVLAVIDRHPMMEVGRQRVRGAEGENLAAEGGFDLMLRGHAWAAPVSYYEWGHAGVRLDQPTELWGASFSAGWRYGRGNNPVYYGQYRTLDGGEFYAGVSVPLWRDGPIDARRRRLWRAGHVVDAEQAAFRAQQLFMRRDAANAYYRWVAAGLKYGVAAALLDLAEMRDGQIRRRVSAGDLPAIEAMESQRAILQRRQVLIGTRRGVERTAIALSLFIRQEDGRPRTPPANRLPSEMRIPAPLEISETGAIRQAFAARPELARFAALEARNRVDLEFFENRFAPRIDVWLGASMGAGGGNEVDNTTLAPPRVEGSIVVELPLQFREARGDIERSRADLQGLRSEAQWMRDQVAAQVRDALSAVRAAEDALDIARQSAVIAEAVAEAERRRFELGDTQLFIVNLREQAAAEAQVALVDAEADVLIARAFWRAAIGAFD